MSYRSLAAACAPLAVVVLLPTAPAEGQTQTAAVGTSSAPRTAWGDPDLQGVWTNVNEAATPFERPEEFGGTRLPGDDQLVEIVQEQHRRAADPETRAKRISRDQGFSNFPIHWAEHLDAPERNERPWLVVDPPDGRVPPLTSEAQERRAAAAAARPPRGTPPAGPEDTGLFTRCITRGGLPGMMMPTWYNNNYQIVQAPGYVAILYEMMHDARIIPLDGRLHLDPHVRQWLGDSRGRWDGDTLVVDVANFTDKTSYRGSTENLHLVERFTRVDADTIIWEVTVEDSTTWAQPWTFAMPLKRGDSQSLVYEYACHEGNSSLESILKGARLADQATTEAASER